MFTFHPHGYPNVAKAGGLHRQGAEGKAVIIYCEPLATLGMKPSGFPGTGKQRSKIDAITRIHPM